MKNKSLYRFMSFESFVDTVQRKSLVFKHPDKWEDPYEGFLYKAIRDINGRKQIIEELRRSNPEYEIVFSIVLDKFSKAIFGQSWTSLNESDALWKIYSFNNMSIRIEVKQENILKLQEVKIYPIKYKDSFSIESEINKTFQENKSLIHEIFLTKRNAFKHEQEVRLLVGDFSYTEDTKSPKQIAKMSVGLKALYKNGQLTEEEANSAIKNYSKRIEQPEIKYISYDEIDGFIESVMLHPQAPNWFDVTISTYCKINKLKYLGKSKLYKFNIQ
ncbi:hypothetical protein ACFL6H_01310 [Candidatus Latescibacterota bacterium]